jgi:hypothetical protein
MAELRFDDGAAYEQVMGVWSGWSVKSFSIGWRRQGACDGSTSAVATGPSPS